MESLRGTGSTKVSNFSFYFQFYWRQKLFSSSPTLLLLLVEIWTELSHRMNKSGWWNLNSPNSIHITSTVFEFLCHFLCSSSMTIQSHWPFQKATPCHGCPSISCTTHPRHSSIGSPSSGGSRWQSTEPKGSPRGQYGVRHLFQVSWHQPRRVSCSRRGV